MLKIIADLLSVKPDKQTFPAYTKELDKKGMLSVQQICLKDDHSEILLPFRMMPDGNNISWWQAYNDTKHDLPKGVYSGRYGNAVNALAALAILHQIAAYAWTRTEHRHLLTEGRNWVVPCYHPAEMNHHDESFFIHEHSGVFFYPMIFTKTGEGTE